MFKILMLLTLQFCSRNLEMGVEYKQPTLAQDNIDLQGFFDSFCFSFRCDGRYSEREVGSKFGDKASKYKDKDDRNLLTGFIVYSHSYQSHWDSFFDALDFFVQLNKDSLCDRDNLGNNFLHYLIIYIASIVGEVDSIENRVVDVLKKLNLQDCDSENSFGLTQVLLAELLGLQEIAKTIQNNNKKILYTGNKKRIKELSGLKQKILQQGFPFAMNKSWSEAEAYTFVLVEALKPNSKQIPTSVLGYCIANITNEVKKTLLQAFHRNDIFEKYDNQEAKKIKSRISGYMRATNTASMTEKASQSGDKDLVIALSENVDKKDLFQSLYRAAQYGHKDVLDHLLSLGVDPNEEDYGGRTPLAAAVQSNHKDIVARLFQVPGIDVNKSGEAGRSPIELAIEYSEVAIVRMLLDVGAELHKVPSIIIAIKSSNPAAYEIVEELLKRKADPNYISKGQGEKTSPLQEAAGQANVKLVELLLANRANPNLQGCSVGPLYLASSSHNLTLIEVLLKGGADPNFCTKAEFLPLIFVAGQLVYYEKLSTETSNSYEENISQLKQAKDLLEKYGAKMDKPIQDGMFPIHKLAQSTYKSADNMIIALLNSGVDADLEDSEGKTPLYYAGSAYQVAKFISLIKRGASLDKAKTAGLDVTALSKKGQRAFIHHLAEEQYFNEILEMKKSYKALNLNMPTGTGKTILHYAVINNVPDNFIDALLDAGCKLSLKENDSKYGPGRYPIQVALRAKNWRIFRHLYRKMLVDPESAQLLEKDRNLRADIDSRAKDGKIKEFMKQAQEEVQDTKKVKGKKRKIKEEDEEEEDDKTKVKKVKVEKTGQKRKGGKK